MQPPQTLGHAAPPAEEKPEGNAPVGIDLHPPDVLRGNLVLQFSTQVDEVVLRQVP